MVEGSHCHAAATLPPGKGLSTHMGGLGGPQGRSGQVWKILPPLGFDPHTNQPVVSCYTIYFVLSICSNCL